MTFLTTFLEMFDWATDINNVQIYRNECNGCAKFYNTTNINYTYRKFYFQSWNSLILIDILCKHSYHLLLYDFCLGEPATYATTYLPPTIDRRQKIYADGWQHVPGIDDAAYFFTGYYTSIFTNTTVNSYQEAVDYCQRIGGKVFEPKESTNNLVAKWAETRKIPNGPRFRYLCLVLTNERQCRGTQ